MKKKTVALLLACVMALGVAVGGTLAWLTDTTQEVKNTFTDSDINITLEETTTNYKMVPGYTIAKDPKTTVKAKSEDCYLFVKVVENLGSWSDNKIEEKDPTFKDYLPYKIADGWIKGEGTGEGQNGVPVGVYYRVVSKSETDQDFYVLKGDGSDAGANKNGYITVSNSVTKEMMDEIDGVDAQGNTVSGEEKPTLSFIAAAVQLYKTNVGADSEKQFTPAEAYDNLPKEFKDYPPATT